MPRPRLGAKPMTAAERVQRSRQQREAMIIMLKAERDQSRADVWTVLNALKSRIQWQNPEARRRQSEMIDALGRKVRFRGYLNEQSEPIFQPGEFVIVIGVNERNPDVLDCIRVADVARMADDDPSLQGDQVWSFELDWPRDDATPVPAGDSSFGEYIVESTKTIAMMADEISVLWSAMRVIAGGHADAQAIARRVLTSDLSASGES